MKTIIKHRKVKGATRIDVFTPEEYKEVLRKQAELKVIIKSLLFIFAITVVSTILLILTNQI